MAMVLLMLPCLALLCAIGGCEGAQHPRRKPNILLIVVDTLRADRLGSYGNGRGLTPFLDRLAAGAAVFRNTYAASSWTRPSVASLLTSRYPSQHGVVNMTAKLGEQELTIAEVLAQVGYRTGAFVTNVVLAPQGGYSQGFQSFFDLTDPKPPYKARATSVRVQSLAWLDTVREENPTTPIFLYLHFMEPHWPYRPEQPYLDRFYKGDRDGSKPDVDVGELTVSKKLDKAFTQFLVGNPEGFRGFNSEEVAVLESLYDAEVASLDHELELLFDELERRDFLRDTIVVFTADHGEEFLDHGSVWHGYTLYEESIRVPLIVRLAGQRDGLMVDQAVSLLDVAPSLIELAGVPVPSVFEGRSFARLLTRPTWLPAPIDAFLRSEHAGQEQIVAELEPRADWMPNARVHADAIIRQSMKLLTRPEGGLELYDLETDPHELNKESEAEPDVGLQLLEALQNTKSALATRADAAAETFKLDEATRERLKALGYGVDDGK